VENRILTRDEIYQTFLVALVEKRPTPPKGWCASKVDEELWKATREYEPDACLRQRDALETSLFYLVDYASRMPERVNLSESNNRVRKMCEELADEIEKITRKPSEIINKRGKLKAWLKAILSVQTCLIYRDETERFIAEEDAAKRLKRAEAQAKNYSQPTATTSKTGSDKWQSNLAKSIFQKASAKIPPQSSEQPSLF
jgi:hypothetical protein